MDSTQVLLLNALLYTITLIIFCKKHGFSIGVVIWSLYTISAWASFLFIQQPGYASSEHASVQTITPCIYLYLVLLVSMSSLMKLKKIEDVEFVNPKLLKIIMIVCGVIQLVFFVVDLPVMLNIASTGMNTLAEFRSSVYEEGNSLVTQNSLLNKISLLYSGIRLLAIGMSVVLFVGYKRDRKLVTFFAVTCLLNNIRVILVQVNRGEMVFVFLVYACSIYLMRDWLSPKTKRIVFLYAIPIVAVGGAFFWAITVSRFGDRATFYMYKYLGEAMNNFNGILFDNVEGTTNGRAYFSLIYKYFMGESTYTTAYEKWSLIKEYTGVRGDIFYTWVGGLIFEFGKGAPIILAIFLNRAIANIARLKTFYSGDIFVVTFFINFFVRGIFLFPTQNYEGTFMIIYVILLYFIFRVRRTENGRIVFVKPKSRFRWH